MGNREYSNPAFLESIPVRRQLQSAKISSVLPVVTMKYQRVSGRFWVDPIASGNKSGEDAQKLSGVRNREGGAILRILVFPLNLMTGRHKRFHTDPGAVELGIDLPGGSSGSNVQADESGRD